MSVIDRIEVFAVVPPGERLTWAHDMAPQIMTGTYLRLTTRCGLQGAACCAGFSEGMPDLSVLETLRPLLPAVVGRDAHHREAIWRSLVSRTLVRAPGAQALVDVALWDWAARGAGLPLWLYLGGARDAVPSYASTPLMPDNAAYVDLVAKLRAEGYRAVKFHCWCDPVRDTAMVRAVAAAHGGAGLSFMLDVEQRYDREAAVRVGRVLSELDYAWFEAPLDDNDLLGYRALARRVAVPLLPAGNSVIDPRVIALALEAGCWTRMRLDVMSAGGITPVLAALALGEAHGMALELQCWGYSLHQAANLAVMLGRGASTWFEQPIPTAPFEHACANPIRTGADGLVRAPVGPGLGLELDWDAITAASVGCWEVRL